MMVAVVADRLVTSRLLTTPGFTADIMIAVNILLYIMKFMTVVIKNRTGTALILQ